MVGFGNTSWAILFGLGALFCLYKAATTHRLTPLRIRKCDERGLLLADKLGCGLELNGAGLGLTVGFIDSPFVLENSENEVRHVDSLRLVVKGLKAVQEADLLPFVGDIEVQPNRTSRVIHPRPLAVIFSSRRLKHRFGSYKPRVFLVVESGGRKTTQRLRISRVFDASH